MIRPILSAISSALTIAGWARAYDRASARAKAAEERAVKAEQEVSFVTGQRDTMYATAARLQRRIVALTDERDAAGFAHASALRDIAEARRLAGAGAQDSPQAIVRELIEQRAQLRVDLAHALDAVDDAKRHRAKN